MGASPVIAHAPAGVLALLLTLGLALAVPLYGHFHEDAYILFIYADHLAAGEGIVFYPGGPPAEGATDFLWMVVLAAGQRLGLDLGLGVALWTALAAGLLGGIASHTAGSDAGARWLRVLLIATTIATVPFAGAAYLGFSAMVFAATAIAVWAAWLNERPRLALLLALVLGLLRPDGVVLGAGFGALLLYESSNKLRTTLPIVLAIGAAYFAWRTWYFGAWLPLPLLVKGLQGDGSLLPGGEITFFWMITATPLLLGAFAGVWGAPRRGRLLLGALPFLLHLGVLALSYQSQNFLFRFQAPQAALLIVLALLPWRFGPPLLRWAGPLLIASLAAMVYAPLTLKTLQSVTTKTSYIDVFPAQVELPEGTRVALTEAGRFPFWTRLPSFDLVGLNTLETATEPVSAGYLQNLDPDLFFVHTYGSLTPPTSDDPVLRVPVADLVRVESTASSSDQRAPHIVLDHLQAHAEDYAVFLVEFLGVHQHLYALRRGRLSPISFERDLRASFGSDTSYLDLRRP